MKFKLVILFVPFAQNSGKIQTHVILEERSSNRSKKAYSMRPSIHLNAEISDKLELALILKAGQFSTESYSDVLYDIFERENIVVPFSRQHSITRATAEPSPAFLDHCRRIIERKFVEPKFGGMIALDLNESYDDPELVFVTNSIAIPVFLQTDDVEPPSNEVHLFLLEIITFRDKDDLEETEVLATIAEFFLGQGSDKDNTWVGIDEYADIDKTYLLPMGMVQESDNDEEFSIKRSSTVFLNDHSSWRSIQKFMASALHGFTYSIAYRTYEMIGVKDSSTDKITFTHTEKIQMGVPTRKTKT